MSRLWRESIRPYLGMLITAVIFMAIMAGANALSAWLMDPVVNEVLVAGNRDMLWIVAGAVFVTFITKGLANFAQATIMAKVGFRIVADMQKRLYTHLTDLDLTYYHHNSTGNLVSRFTFDIQGMRVAVSHAITVFGKDLLSLIGLVAVLFIQDPLLAFIAIFVFPVAILPVVKIGRRMRKVTANYQEGMGIFTTLLEQTFQGIRVVKAYGMEDYERGRVNALVSGLCKEFEKAARTRALNSPIMETLGGTAATAIIVYGGYRVMDNQMDAGSFISFLVALLMAYEPMKRLANLNSTVQEGLAGAERTFQALDHPITLFEKDDAKPLSVDKGEVHFSNVSFTYPQADDVEAPLEEALKGINITVPAGKTVALVGASGAGKSTIMNLAPRFYEVSAGAVLIDGQDVRDVDFKTLRDAMALVSQEVTLFDDTVRANIAYGRPDANFDDIQNAARHAAAHDFILSLPNGYDTMVGERGVRLSGGQRQRLAIARAMLKNAPILLLDEATSALDTESERHVQNALDELMADRTTLVIAHRLSTVVDADLIYVLDQGQVVEQGTHAELLEQDGQYANLYQLQFVDVGNSIEGEDEETEAEPVNA